MTAPGQVANDLRAQARYWDRRVSKSSRLIAHLERAASLIDAAVRTGPRKGLVKRLRRAQGWMLRHRDDIRSHFGGWDQLWRSLDRAAQCLLALALEAENAR